MTREDLYRQMKQKGTMLCVGLDSDYRRLPACVRERFRDPAEAVLAFNRAVIDAVAPYCIALNPNTAFYESLGGPGMEVLAETAAYARSRHPELFLLADAKRGDIGNTAEMYARAFFESMDFDAVTLSPYMGLDTVRPFLGRPGKFAVVVALSSNPSASDFQEEGALWRRVMTRCAEAGTPDELMFVVGATRAERLTEVREVCPDHFLLVPGVGAQGGSAEEVIARGANALGGLLINSSRAVLYASGGEDFAEAAARVAACTARYTDGNTPLKQ